MYSDMINRKVIHSILKSYPTKPEDNIGGITVDVKLFAHNIHFILN